MTVKSLWMIIKEGLAATDRQLTGEEGLLYQLSYPHLLLVRARALFQSNPIGPKMSRAQQEETTGSDPWRHRMRRKWGDRRTRTQLSSEAWRARGKHNLPVTGLVVEGHEKRMAVGGAGRSIQQPRWLGDGGARADDRAGHHGASMAYACREKILRTEEILPHCCESRDDDYDVVVSKRAGEKRGMEGGEEETRRYCRQVVGECDSLRGAVEGW